MDEKLTFDVQIIIVVKMANINTSKKRKFVADGVFYSEINEVRLIYSLMIETYEICSFFAANWQRMGMLVWRFA